MNARSTCTLVPGFAQVANGSTANDAGGLTGGRLETGLDPTAKGFYHGGDLAGSREQLAGEALQERGPVAGQCFGHRPQPGGDRSPVLVGLGGHDGEDAAYGRTRR